MGQPFAPAYAVLVASQYPGGNNVRRGPIMRRRHALLLAAIFALVAGRAIAADPAKSLVVFGAASLSDALTEVGAAFSQETGIAIKPSFAASSVLARQIEAGAPADVFFP